MQNDIGPGNIRTAIELLHEYKASGEKDTLNLLIYLNDYSQLVRDMSDRNKIITPALVGLYLRKAEGVVKESTTWDRARSHLSLIYELIHLNYSHQIRL